MSRMDLQLVVFLEKFYSEGLTITPMEFFLALAIGYFLGALPFAVWIGRFYGVNALTQGSCNPGATNILRLVGKKAGYTVFALDALKGSVAVLLAQQFLSSNNPWLPIVALCGTLLGHSFSCFIGFRGGKGVATTIGGLLVLMPMILGLGGIVWGIAFSLWRYVSLASILLAASLPIWSLIFLKPMPDLLLSIAIMAFIILRHRTNLKRLWQGKESRFDQSKPNKPTA